MNRHKYCVEKKTVQICKKLSKMVIHRKRDLEGGGLLLFFNVYTYIIFKCLKIYMYCFYDDSKSCPISLHFFWPNLKFLFPKDL